MSREAKTQKQRNRYTGANMTAREAQTLVGSLRKIRKIQRDLMKREAFILTRIRMDELANKIIDTIEVGGRKDEIPYQLLG